MSWKAQYEQYEQWHNMTFASLQVQQGPGGKVQGHGSDGIGEFTFEGSFSQSDPTVKILKQYTGKHAIYYQGTLNMVAGQINGHWGFSPGGKDGQWYGMTLESSTFELAPGGKIKATGVDEVGKFTFDGSFSAKDSIFKFLKQYIGQHKIYYQGKFNKKTFEFQGHWGYDEEGHQGGFRMKKI